MDSKQNSWVSNHQLLAFFLLTYAINCAVSYGSMYLVSIPQSVVWFFQAFSPTMGALVVSGLIGGLGEIKRLLSGFTKWKAGLKWYIAALSLTFLPFLFAMVYWQMGNPIAGITPGTTMAFLLSNLVFTLFSGPLSEEAGWRGFALPRLQKRYNALLSSVILGVIWACWHIPFYANSGGKVGMPLPIYIVMVTVLTIFITWIYNNTKGSLVLCVLSHFCFNFDSGFIAGYLGLLPRMVFNIGAGALLFVYIIILLVVFGPTRLSKRASNITAV